MGQVPKHVTDKYVPALCLLAHHLSEHISYLKASLLSVEKRKNYACSESPLPALRRRIHLVNILASQERGRGPGGLCARDGQINAPWTCVITKKAV
jgi:hypothetical protein